MKEIGISQIDLTISPKLYEIVKTTLTRQEVKFDYSAAQIVLFMFAINWDGWVHSVQ